MKSILDSTFKYYPAVQTDLRRTFQRVRQQMVAQHGSQPVTSQARQAAPVAVLPVAVLPVVKRHRFADS